MDEQQKRMAEELIFAGANKKSFAKQLYFGDFDFPQVFPYPKVDQKEEIKVEALLEKLSVLIKDKIHPIAIDQTGQIPEDVLNGLADLGIFGMTIPEEYGGLGLSQYAYCRVEEMLAYTSASVAFFVSAHQSLGLKAILLFGTVEQKKKWLPDLAQGKQYAAFCLSELNAGSDAAGIETKAVFDAEKNVYRITGKKHWITHGSVAGVLTVMAKTKVGDQERTTAFIVTPDMEGFKITDDSLDKMGMRGTKTSNLEFHDMHVPIGNILGPVGAGLKVCLTVLDYGRTTFGAICTGVAKFGQERAIYHAKTRIQFKRSIASFALIKEKIALISALNYAIEATTYLTAGFVDSKSQDFMLESAMLKVFASDSLWKIIYETMQIHGGRSYFTDAPFERLMRDARFTTIGEGANEVLRAFIGLVGMRDVGMELKEVLGVIKNPFSQPKVLSRFSMSLIKRLKTPLIPLKSEHLKDERKAISKAIRRLGFAIIKILTKYGEEVFERQLSLDRIASCAIAIYTSTAVLSKLDDDLEEVKGNRALLGDDLNIGKYYVRYAVDNLNHSLDSLFRNNDEMIESLSDQITRI